MSGEVLTGLRRWSAGSATDAAAVELLALVSDGRLVKRSCPWVQPCGRLGWFCLDAGPLVQLQGRLQGVDRHLVALVVALLANKTVSKAGRTDVEAAA